MNQTTSRESVALRVDPKKPRPRSSVALYTARRRGAPGEAGADVAPRARGQPDRAAPLPPAPRAGRLLPRQGHRSGGLLPTGQSVQADASRGGGSGVAGGRHPGSGGREGVGASLPSDGSVPCMAGLGPRRLERELDGPAHALPRSAMGRASPRPASGAPRRCSSSGAWPRALSRCPSPPSRSGSGRTWRRRRRRRALRWARGTFGLWTRWRRGWSQGGTQSRRRQSEPPRS